MLSRQDRVLCGLLVSRGLVSGEELKACTDRSDLLEGPSAFTESLLELGVVDRQILREMLNEASRVASALSREPAVCEEFLGRYKILREIGRGGMGVVYEVLCLEDGRHLAAKVLPRLLPDDERVVARFRREADVAARLDHPGIVRVHETGEDQGILYFVMDLVDGGSLHEQLREGPLDSAEAARMALEIAAAVDHAHALGLVHRDIKPGNILLTRDGRPRVADFGIVHDLEQETLATTCAMLGTPAYVSLEQACGDPASPLHDVYSMGAVLYTMLSARPPYEGDMPVTVLLQLITREPASLDAICPDRPAALCAICRKAMARDPGERYQSARELRDDLETYLAGGRTDAIAHPPHAMRPERPPGRWGGVALAALLLVTAVALALIIPSTRGPPETAGPVWGGITRLTFSRGREHFPTFHPDGRRYAFERGGKIHLASIANGLEQSATGVAAAIDEEILIENTDEFCTQPAFSPGGSELAFRCGRAGGIRVLNLAERTVRQLTRGGFNPSWSPDGSQIVYASANTIGASRGHETSELWVVDVSSGEQRRLFAGDAAQPSWSPHGQRIAFWSHDDEGTGVWTMPAEGGEPTRVSRGSMARDWGPVWSPDGASLYLVSDRSGWANVWRVPIDEDDGRVTGSPEPVTRDISCLCFHPAISRDGDKLLFSRWAYDYGLLAIPFDRERGTVLGEPTSPVEHLGILSAPTAAPDGRSLALTLHDRFLDLAVLDLGGLDLRSLTRDAPRDESPCWSPTGEWIAFHSDRTGSDEIWLMKPDGQDAIQVTHKPASSVIFPFWSPDGSRVGYSVEGRGTCTLGLASALEGRDDDEICLPARGGDEPFYGIDWSPDGREVAGNAGSSLVIHSLRSGVYRTVAERGRWPLWLPDGRRLLYCNGGEIWLADLSADTARLVYRSEMTRINGRLSLGADGMTLYATENRSEGDLWLMRALPEDPRPPKD